jgi:hypothetical protein
MKAGDRVRVLASRCAPGHERPDFTATIESVGDLTEHMGRPFRWVSVRDEGGRAGVWPSHRLELMK